MKTTKVYHAPGYPLDPKKEEKRGWDRAFECVIKPPKLIQLQSQTVDFTFGSHEEAERFVKARTEALIHYYSYKDRK